MSSHIGRVLLAGLLLVQAVSGWGARGHRIIANIAASRLTRLTAANVRLILGGHSMSDVASWADEVRGTAEYAGSTNWHFVNIPRDAVDYNQAQHCPVSDHGDCIIEALAREFEALSGVDPANPTPSQVDALRFLIHFRGDLHQPFHAVSDYANGFPDGDRGGNRVTVSLLGESSTRQQRPWNLHAVWDGGLMSAVRPPEAEYLAQLLISAPPTPTIQLDRITLIAWAMESHDVALKAYVPGGSDLGASYCETQAKVMDQRIQLAGVRLAAVLNQLPASQP